MGVGPPFRPRSRGCPVLIASFTTEPAPSLSIYIQVFPQQRAGRQRGDDSRRESTRVTRFPLSRKRSCPSLVSIWLTRYLRRGHGEVGCSFTNARTSTPASKRHLREQFNAVNSGHRRRCRGTWGRVHGTFCSLLHPQHLPAQARRGPGSEGLGNGSSGRNGAMVLNFVYI
jgi:hypothetical protein